MPTTGFLISPDADRIGMISTVEYTYGAAGVGGNPRGEMGEAAYNAICATLWVDSGNGAVVINRHRNYN